MLIYAINIAVGRVLYTFRHDAPQADEPDYLVTPGAFVAALDAALGVSVGRLPSASKSLEFERFTRTVLPVILKNSSKGGGLDGGSDTEGSESPPRSKRSGRRSREKKRTADTTATAVGGRASQTLPRRPELRRRRAVGVGRERLRLPPEREPKTRSDPTKFIKCRNRTGAQTCDR